MASQYSSPANRTVYFELVWELVRQIPAGKVSTYGRIAAFLPAPAGMSERAYQVRGARMVGGAMAACPSDVPWQRVINSQGKVSLRKSGGGEQQRTMLESEGVKFNESERVDLSVYAWEGPSQE
ncbi:MAG: MGMT family protein [Anaerolineales bacterium]|nr:MGMT family protein [Anaerolineales bacterium]